MLHGQIQELQLGGRLSAEDASRGEAPKAPRGVGCAPPQKIFDISMSKSRILVASLALNFKF